METETDPIEMRKANENLFLEVKKIETGTMRDNDISIKQTIVVDTCFECDSNIVFYSEISAGSFSFQGSCKNEHTTVLKIERNRK